MTKKDYIAIAGALNDARTLTGTNTAAVTISAGCIADVLQRDNPRFDRARFLAAVHRLEVSR